MKVKPRRIGILGALLSLLTLGITSASALATTADEITVLPTLDPLNRTENPLSNAGRWSALNWASNAGQDTSTGWMPASFSTVAGAYWNPSAPKDQSGDAVALKMVTAPGISERYLSVWLNMPSPGTAKSGYQLRWTVNSTTTTYTVKISKWVSGAETVLASNASVTIPAGSTLALADTGSTVTAYLSTGGAFSALLSGSDSSYTGGYAGIEGSGSNSRSTTFKAGALPGAAIQGVPILDSFERQEVPLANGKWTKTAWTTSIGGSWYPSYHGYGTGSSSGVYWNSATFDDSKGPELAAATVGTASSGSGEWQALWLNMPNPGAEQSGYEARLSGTGTASTYKVELSKWVAGTRTVLGTKDTLSVPVNTTIALSESGGSVVLWTGTSSFTPLLSATDSTYTSGYAGLEVKGGAGTDYNFRAGSIAQPPNTTITSGPSGTVFPDISFSFTSTEAGSTFECSLDGVAYSSCTSPKAYQGLAEGSHTFRVRASGAYGTDESPAERSFQVAGVGASVAKVPVRDDFGRQEVPLANGKWTKTAWGTEIGGSWLGAYHGYGGSGSGSASAYWNQATFSAAEQPVLTTATVGTGSPGAGEYLALWQNMPSPGSARTGYEARFSGVNGSPTNYKVELSRWASGTRTVLGTKEGFSLPVNTTMVLMDGGTTVSLWTGTGTSFTQQISASDSTYNSGSAGLEVVGGAGTVYNFRAGQTDFQAPDTTIQTGPTGTVNPEAVSFTFTASESGSTFECSVDGGAYSSCTSPKAYPTIGSGAHTFRVRAVDGAANQDPTPAERSFSVVQPPNATTKAATSVKATQATLNADVNPNSSSTTYQFEYGTTTSYGSKIPATVKNIGSGTTGVEASEPITGLTAGTLYHFRISATNAAGTTKGADQTFTTTAAPVVVTEAASEASATEAKLNATVNPKGAATTYQFEYGPTTAYGTKAPITAKSAGSGQSAVQVAETIAGLEEGHVYHFRVVATNEVGTTNGADQTFTTPYLPGALTEGAERVEANDAIVNAEVDPNGEDTTYKFEYGLTSAYGSVAPARGDEVGEEGEAANATDALVDLKPATTYHYRVVATSPAGTVSGPDKTLTTDASSLTPQFEAERDQERVTYTGKLNGGLPTRFMGMMWSGNRAKIIGQLEPVKHSGAKMFRFVIHPNEFSENEIDAVIQRAADKDIEVLPYIQPGVPGQADPTFWNKYIRETVERLGPGGKYWATNVGADLPVRTWEIGNEPNISSNWPGEPKPINAASYGNMFAEFSASAKAGASNRGGSIDILLAGLLATSPTGCKRNGQGQITECHKDAPDFIEKMGHTNSYDAVSIHPYVFKIGGSKITEGDIPAVKKKIYGRLLNVRNALEHMGEGNKDIWITELGWPVGDYPSQDTFPPVSEELQRQLINATFNEIEADWKELQIRHLFYYNIQDNPTGTDKWDKHLGLRRGTGKKRPSWSAYANQAGGEPNWPANTKVNNRPAYSLKGHSAGLKAGVDDDGSEAAVHFQYWKPAPNPNVITTSDATVEGIQAEQDVSRNVTGLQPLTEYVFHAVATNEEEVTTVGANETFNTPPSSSTSNHIRRILHGNPGWIWVDGWVKDGYMTGPEAGVGIPNVNVHIKFYQNGSFVESVNAVTNSEGFYSSGYITRGHGEWETQTEFPGGGEWDASASGVERELHIRDGVEIIAKHSGKCMDVEGAWMADGVRVMHGTCHGGSNQVFTLRPKDGGTSLEMIARHSGKCVDVANAATNNGAAIVQHGCNWGYNQAFREDWIPDTEYTKYVAVHSQKCLDVTGGSTEWAPFQQWDCNGNAQQAFRLQPVESDPIPTETTITMDQELHGSPGWMTFHGRLDAGAYSMANRVVHVEFDDRTTPGWDDSGGHFTFGIDGNNFYAKADAELKPGYWNMRARFMGDGEFGYSESGLHELVIRRGNHFVNRYSDMCLSLSEAWQNYNGQPFIQWPCSGNPSGGDGQVFSFWPQGNGYYNLRLNGTGRCADVAGGSTDNHAQVRQWDCGPGDWQEWDIVPISGQSPWVAFVARHSGKCLDNTGPTKDAGSQIFQQYECNWTGGQQWRIDWVIFP